MNQSGNTASQTQRVSTGQFQMSLEKSPNKENSLAL